MPRLKKATLYPLFPQKRIRMTHELKTIIGEYEKARKEGIAAVLATVVALDGSSYRRPGVRMLILEDGTMVGAVSGGCVEKAIRAEAVAVFKEKNPRIMTYDGRYRLGCEGVLHILIEPMLPDDKTIAAFWSAVEKRKSIKLYTHFAKNPGEANAMGTVLETAAGPFALDPVYKPGSGLEVLVQDVPPCNRLYILGAEHDSVALTHTAVAMGWEVCVVAAPDEDKEIANFPGASRLYAISPGELAGLVMDRQTAVMVMSHNFARDLAYLHALHEKNPAYIGILGPAARREQLFGEILERIPDVGEEFLDSIHGPAGIDIGAETAAEIAISIMGEILAVFRGAELQFLKNKKGRIHSR